MLTGRNHHSNAMACITGGEVRTQDAHLVDMVPTVLDALGIAPPAQIRGVTQSPIEGVSFAHVFDDGWRAVCPVPGPSVAEAGVGFGEMALTEDKLRELDATGWELYHVAGDIAETEDVSERERARLLELIATWYVEAGKYHVLPLDSRGTARLVEGRSSRARATTTSTTRAPRWCRTTSPPASSIA